MCRHLAYLGAAQTIGAIVCDRPYSLMRQAWAPRAQRNGVVNADGFGVGWYAAGHEIPARYRRTGPIWADPSFLDLARVTSTTALLASVRSATKGTAHDESAAAPYRRGTWLFSHNGAVAGWPGSVVELAAALPARVLLDLEARTDAALLWAMIWNRLETGVAPQQALASTVNEVAAVTSGRLNLLMTDGTTIVASAYGETLVYRTADGCCVVASEPDDDGAGWMSVPNRSILVATVDSVTVEPLRATTPCHPVGQPADQPRETGNP